MTDPLHEQVARVRAWYNLVADAFVQRYDDRSGWYFARCEEDLLYSVCRLKDRRVLDLGTGAGRLLPRLSNVARFVAAADISEALLRKSPHVPRTALLQMNALDLGFRAATFDAVVSLGLFEYVADLDPFLAEIRRVLRPSGQVAFTYHQAPADRAVDGEPMNAPYFGRTIGERAQYWSKRRHERGEIRRTLARHGFRNVRGYRVFFRVPQQLYGLSSRFAPASPADRVLRGSAVIADRVLGRVLRPVTQFWTGNVLVVADASTVTH
jgi:ubiquinone/menaquinone biosynthesis C-methylase UbiE